MEYDSSHEYKVIEHEVNQLLPCAEISIVRPITERYRAFGDGTIQGAGLTVKCVKKAPENVTKVLTWGGPEKRENGDPLPIEEIRHYMLEYNGQTKIIPKDQTSYTINGLSSESIIFTMWTVDTDGLKSKPVTAEG